MGKDELLRHKDHYRCRLCGQLSPITETLCTKPSCRAQLSIYGELIAAEDDKKPTDNPKTVKFDIPDIVTTESTTIQPEEKVKKHKERVKPDTADTKRVKHKAPGNHANKWKASTIVLGCLAAVMALAMFASFNEVSELRSDNRYLRRENSDLDDDYDKLKDDYDAIKDDYNVIKYDYDDLKLENDKYHEFWDNNGLSKLYTVKVNKVFNCDEEGNRIDDKLNLSTMTRLGSSIDITAAEIENRWEEPLVVKLIQSGKENAYWTIRPGDDYGDETKSVSWTIWTNTVQTAGEYVAEFYHYGYMVARYEITVKE